MTTSPVPMQDTENTKKRPASTNLSESAPDAKKQRLSDDSASVLVAQLQGKAQKNQKKKKKYSHANARRNGRPIDEQARGSDTRPRNENKDQDEGLAPKRKVVIVIGYKGTNFHGNQIQPKDVTVEGDVWNALKQTKGVRESNKSDWKKIGWARTSRTDRGVHALVNLIECKLHHYDEIVPELNALLKKEDGSNDVMVHGISRVTGGFKARMSCDSREYWYLLPTFVFNPKDKLLSYDFSKESATDKDRLDQLMFQISQEELDTCVDRSYRMSAEDLERTNKIMNRFEGTHRYHNFTRMTKNMKPNQTQRYVTKFSIAETFYDENTGLEWAVCHIYGSSFLFNQIRKMLGLTIAVAKGIFDESIFDKVFDGNVEMYTPRIPGHGLMLKDTKFGSYNNSKGETHGTLNPYADFSDNIEIFKKQLFEHIMLMEKDHQEWQRFIYLLNKIIKTEKDPIDYEKAAQREKDTTIVADVEINAPIAKVWAEVGDFARLPHLTLEKVHSVKIDKSSTEIGALRIVEHYKMHTDNTEQLRVKKHVLDAIDTENYTIEYSNVRLKRYTETSTVRTTIQLTAVDESKTKLVWKTNIDVGTGKFVGDETNRIKEHAEKVKKYFESEAL